MKIVTLGLAAAAAAVALPGAARAQGGCAEFAVGPAELRISYDPYNRAQVERTFTMRVRRQNAQVTAVRLIVADPDPVRGQPTIGIDGPEVYAVRWARDAGRQVFGTGAEQPNGANGALVSFGEGPRGSVRNEMFRLQIPAGQDVGAGTYYQPLEIRYQCYAGEAPLGGVQVQAGGMVAIDLAVPEKISSFIGSQGVRRARLDFGPLTLGSGNVTRSLAITTQATMPYEAEFRAEYGTLKRAPTDRAAVDYALWFNEIPVADRSRVACARPAAPGGRTSQLRAEVNGDQARTAPAGAYGDIVTITFSPRLGLAGGNGCTLTRR